MNQTARPAPHLTLVSNTGAVSHSPTLAALQPVPTYEFLSRRIMSLCVDSDSVGKLLVEAASFLEPNAPESYGRYGCISDALRLIGIWIWAPETDDDPPTHGLVVHPEKLVKRYPDLKRWESALEGLRLELPVPR